MFKFFRQYDKLILTVGATLLMIGFLIQPTLSMFAPDPTNSSQAIGMIGDTQLTFGDQRQAANQLRAISALSPQLAQVSGFDSLQWLLILHDADRMGLSVSWAQVDQFLGEIGQDDAMLGATARRLGLSTESIRQAARDWVVVQEYVELVYGLTHGGQPRISEPLRQRFLYDYQATVKVSALPIRADQYLEQIDEPNEQRLAEHFEHYKDSLPGQGTPHGFGYRVPDRVKIEYLSIPFKPLRDQVQIEDEWVQARRYFKEHIDDLRDENQPDDQDATASDPISDDDLYELVRDKIINQLRDEQASQLAARMIKTAQAMLMENTRGLPLSQGYRQFNDGWAPIPLRAVADKLWQQFGVSPQTIAVQREDDHWLTFEGLTQLPGINSSQLISSRPIPFLLYVRSAKELLKPNDPPELASFRLQTRIPSRPLKSNDGSLYLFRLVDAQQDRTPESIDEIRQQVVRDVKQIDAYQILKDHTNEWLDRAKQESIQILAGSLGTTIITTNPFPRRQPGPRGLLQVPNIPGIGQSQGFVDQVFEHADLLVDDQGVLAPPSPRRITAIPVDQQQNLWLVQLDRFQPMSKSLYDVYTQTDQIASQINTSISRALIGPNAPDPLSIESLSARVGYVPARADDEDSTDTPAPPEAPDTPDQPDLPG